MKKAFSEVKKLYIWTLIDRSKSSIHKINVFTLYVHTFLTTELQFQPRQILRGDLSPLCDNASAGLLSVFIMVSFTSFIITVISWDICGRCNIFITIKMTMSSIIFSAEHIA